MFWKNSTPADLLLIYFDFLYYIGLAPVRFRESTVNEKNYEARSSIFHKITSVAIQLLLTYQCIRNVVNLLWQDWSNFNPIMYFDLVTEFATFSYFLTFVFMLWRKNTAICEILNLLSAMRNYFPCHNFFFQKYPKLSTLRVVALTSCILCILSPTGHIVFGINVLQNKTWSLECLRDTYATETEYMFFLRNRDNRTIPCTFDEVFPTRTFVLMGFYLISKFYLALQDHYADLLVGIFSLSFWKISQEFNEYIINNANDFDGILERFAKVKRAVRKIQLVVGPLFLFSIVRFLSHNAGYIGIGYLTANHDFYWAYFIFMGFFMIHVILNLVICAEGTHQMAQIKAWVTSEEIRSKMSRMDFLVLYDEIRTGPIGLRASGLPTCTYGFIRTVFGIFISYIILMLQLQTTNNHGSCPAKLNSKLRMPKGVASLYFDD